jgi:hypothetical protein
MTTLTVESGSNLNTSAGMPFGVTVTPRDTFKNVALHAGDLFTCAVTNPNGILPRGSDSFPLTVPFLLSQEGFLVATIWVHTAGLFSLAVAQNGVSFAFKV